MIRILLIVLCSLSFKLQADAYAQLSSLATQVPATGAAAVIRLDTIDAIKNIELGPTKDKIIIKESGIYLVMAAGQIGSTNAVATGYLDFWFIKNGAQVPNSNVRMSVDPSNSTGVLLSQSVMEFKSGDVLSIAYASSGSAIGFIFTRPDNEPAIPSMIFTLLKIDTSSEAKSGA